MRLGVGNPYVQQSTLDDPPLAPDRLMFVTHAVVHIGRATNPDWNDVERTALHFPAPAIPSTLAASKLVSLERPPPKPAAVWNVGAGESGYAAALAKWQNEAPARLAAAEATVRDDQGYLEEWRAGIIAHAPAVAALNAAAKALCRAVINGSVTPYFRDVAGGAVQQMQ
jgi:hypothetical protein